MASPKRLPEFVLFGDSLTEWSFNENTQGFGLFLEESYADTVAIINEGTQSLISYAGNHCSFQGPVYGNGTLTRFCLQVKPGIAVPPACMHHRVKH